jgi:hypothetical protein
MATLWKRQHGRFRQHFLEPYWISIGPFTNSANQCSNSSTKLNIDIYHVDGARLRLWTVATNRPIAFSPGDIWAWRTTVQWYRQGKTLASLTRALWQPYQQSHLVPNQEKLGEENYQFSLRNVFVHTYFEVFFACRKILRHRADGFTSPPKKGVLLIFIALKNPLPWPSLNSRTFGKMAGTLTVTPPRRMY